MTADEIRLECLKLAHRHDKSPDEIVTNAKVFEEYVSASRTLSVNPRAGTSKRAG